MTQRTYEDSLLESGKQAWDLIEQLQTRVVELERSEKALRRVLQDKDDRLLCLVCSDRPRTVVFMNCRHCCVCGPCARSLQQEHQVSCSPSSRTLRAAFLMDRCLLGARIAERSRAARSSTLCVCHMQRAGRAQAGTVLSLDSSSLLARAASCSACVQYGQHSSVLGRLELLY
jgi:hypothetical protein